MLARPWYRRRLTTAGRSQARACRRLALEADLDYPIANYCTDQAAMVMAGPVAAASAGQGL